MEFVTMRVCNEDFRYLPHLDATFLNLVLSSFAAVK